MVFRDLIQLLSPREWAIATWLTVLFAWALLREGFRRSVWSLIKSILSWKVFATLVSVIIYASAIVYGYKALGIDYERIWIGATLWVFYGFYLAVRYVSKHKYSHVWRDVVQENLRGVVLLEVLINTYTFSFLFELFLVPVIVIVSMLGAVAESDKAYRSIAKLTDWILAVLGFGILAYAVVQALNNPDVIGSVDTLSAISLPVVLALGFIPVIYLFLVVSHYEQIFMRLDMGVPKSKDFKRKAKWELMKSLRLRYARLNSFVGPKSAALMRVESIEEVRKLLKEGEQAKAQ